MKRILVVRNDKLGDFMLAWPALALLKQAGCEVTVLVPEYTAPLARLCPAVDHVLIDVGVAADKGAQAQMLADIRAQKFDAALALFSNWRNASFLQQAKIPYRLAPATKLAQIRYTHRLTQRRSRSEKPEWVYNLDLAARLLTDFGLPITSVSAPYFPLSAACVSQARAHLAQSLTLPTTSKWMMVHVGSGGSANNLSLEQYEQLVVALSERLDGWQFVLTAGPAEEAVVGGVYTRLLTRRVPVAIWVSTDGLAAFAQGLATASAMVAGSTGPLHVAGALDVPTVGFFPRLQSSTALRWQTLNTPARHLAISVPEDSADAESFASLDMALVADQVSNWSIELDRSTGST
jgi:ADP-heptose:LPS heptosyltransferase